MEQQSNKTPKHPLAKTHLVKVILVHNTTVGQRLEQPLCQGRFAPIGDPKSKQHKSEHLIVAWTVFQHSKDVLTIILNNAVINMQSKNGTAEQLPKRRRGLKRICGQYWISLHFWITLGGGFSKVPLDWQQTGHMATNTPSSLLQSGGRLIINVYC